MRTIFKNGKFITYLINLSHNNIDVILNADFKGKVKDIISGKESNIGDSLNIEPRKPLLLEVSVITPSGQ